MPQEGNEQVAEQAQEAATPAPTPTPSIEGPTAAELQAKYIESQTRAQQKEWELTQKLKATESRLAELEKGQYSDPYEAFTALGGDPDELVNRIVSNGKPSVESEVEKLRAELSAIKQENMTKEEKAREQALQQQRVQYFNSYAGDVWREVTNNPDYSQIKDILEFEALIYGSNDPQAQLASIVEKPLIEKFNKTGRELTPSEFLGNISKDVPQLVEKIRNSEALRRLMGIEQQTQAEHAEDTGQELPNVLTQQHAAPESGKIDPAKLPRSKFYQWVDENFKNK